MKILSENLKKIRGFKGFNRKALSEASGVSEAAIWKIERCKTDPSVKTLAKLSQALDCHLYLFFVEDLNFGK